MATIISFANQKGGVGKTTLCATFANYLSRKGDPLLVIDSDNQKSLLERRKADISKYPDTPLPYNIQALEITNTTSVECLMQKLRDIEGIILIDTPGHLSQQGLIPLFTHSDFIICPYQYDAISINSTITFLRFFKALSSRVETMSTQLLLVPNRYDKRIGKKEELALWEKTSEAFSKYGEILPRIDMKADMQRFNTISLLDSQFSIVQPSYERIYELIKPSP